MTQPREHSDWRNDWLYSLIFKHADDSWQMCRRRPDSKYWQYLLISEWSSAGDAMCRGEPVRAWRRDEDGLREITIDQYKEQKKTIQGRIYPFILIKFNISADRTRVVYGHREASTAGSGCRYIVDGEGQSAKLKPDPDGGFWIS